MIKVPYHSPSFADANYGTRFTDESHRGVHYALSISSQNQMLPWTDYSTGYGLPPLPVRGD
jgi:hypothetical protein